MIIKPLYYFFGNYLSDLQTYLLKTSSTKIQGQTNEESLASSVNGTGTLGIHMQKNRSQTIPGTIYKK